MTGIDGKNIASDCLERDDNLELYESGIHFSKVWLDYLIEVSHKEDKEYTKEQLSELKTELILAWEEDAKQSCLSELRLIGWMVSNEAYKVGIDDQSNYYIVIDGKRHDLGPHPYQAINKAKELV